MNVQYKFDNSDEVHQALILHTEEFKNLEVMSKNGAVEIKKDNVTLFFLSPGAGYGIEEIRITDI